MKSSSASEIAVIAKDTETVMDAQTRKGLIRLCREELIRLCIGGSLPYCSRKTKNRFSCDVAKIKIIMVYHNQRNKRNLQNLLSF